MEIKLTDKECEEVFYTSLCNVYGNGYWNGYGLEINVSGPDYTKARKALQDKNDAICIEDVFMQVLRQGGTLNTIDHEKAGYDRKITLEHIHQVMDTAPPERLLAIINEQDDVDDADQILQHCFFGSVIFG
jgi:hypothetical protein